MFATTRRVLVLVRKPWSLDTAHDKEGSPWGMLNELLKEHTHIQSGVLHMSCSVQYSQHVGSTQ